MESDDRNEGSYQDHLQQHMFDFCSKQWDNGAAIQDTIRGKLKRL
jgi:hypothetical protein